MEGVLFFNFCNKGTFIENMLYYGKENKLNRKNIKSEKSDKIRQIYCLVLFLLHNKTYFHK